MILVRAERDLEFPLGKRIAAGTTWRVPARAFRLLQLKFGDGVTQVEPGPLDPKVGHQIDRMMRRGNTVER